MDTKQTATLLQTLHFAADKHRDQRRKDPGASPYINHPIAVAELLARQGGVSDLTILQAALLHDTVEDTETSLEELVDAFGSEVGRIVDEVSDDKSLEKARRKQLQIEHAPHLSEAAKVVKLSDKICNVSDVTREPPKGWSLERRREYLDWTEKVVAGLRGTNATLEKLYDNALALGRETLGEADGAS
ncbi:MAG: HD domain-containing protein [Myxococcota bacterium]|nr:HD domain-containing protein [Myxococcota bacterium]